MTSHFLASLAPTPIAARPWRFPATTRTRLDNGLDVISCHMPDQYLAGLTAVLDLPLKLEPYGQDGVIALALRTMDEGTQNYSSEGYAQAVDRLGANYRADLSFTGAWADIDVPVRNLDQAAALLAAAVCQPEFGETEVSRQRALRIGEIAHENSDPSTRSHQEFLSQLFTVDDRFSRPVRGTRTTVEALDSAALHSLHTACVTPTRTTLVCTGDLSGVDVALIADRHFGTWSTTGTSTMPITAPRYTVRPTHQPHIVVVDRPRSVQTTLALGFQGPKHRETEPAGAETTLQLFASILVSRLNSVLREERGYSYGLRASYQRQGNDGFMLIKGSVRGKGTGSAVTELLGQLESAAREGIQAQEWTSAVQQLTRVAPLRYERAGVVRSQLAELVVDGRPLDHLDASTDALQHVTASAASSALRDLIESHPVIIVALGSATEITAQLSQAGLEVSEVL